MGFYKRILISFFIGLASCANAQHYNLKKYSISNGLVNINVLNICQDKTGYIWIAAQGGLNRFDGSKFISYHKSNGLPSSDVTAVLEDSRGNLWVGTTEGLARFDGLKFFTLKNNGLNHKVYSIYEDAENNVWFCTEGGGLIVYNGSTFKQITRANGLPTDSVFSVIQDHEKNYWLGTYHFGVCKIQKSSIQKNIISCTTYSKKDGLSSNNIFCILEDKFHTLWLGTTNGAVSLYKNGTFSSLHLPEEMQGDYVSQLIEDARGNIWIGTWEHGLLKYSGNKITVYDEAIGLPSHLINSLFADNSNNIWIGTEQGLCIFKNDAMLNFNETEGLTSKTVQSIFQTQDGTLLCGTALGMSFYDGNRFTKITEIPELVNFDVNSIATDNLGKIWLGSANQGILILDKKKNFRFEKSIFELAGIQLSTPVYTIINAANSIWIATYGQGLFKIDSEKVTHYSRGEGLTNDNLLSLFMDKKNTLWIGTYQGGVYSFNGTNFTNYTTADGLADNTIYGIEENKNGALFFASAEGGLSCFDGKKFTTLSTKDGLSSNLIYTVKVDAQKNLWLGTTTGLTRLKLKPDFTVDSIKIFTEQNGLEGSLFMSSNSLYIDTKGIIWAGTTKGLTKYNPALDFQNTTPPALVLEDILLFSQKVDWKKYELPTDPKTSLPLNLELSYKNNHLTFVFQALAVDDNLKYVYQLDGFDKKWSTLSASTSAIYSNIPSGKTYTFRVRAINGDGIWSEKDIAYTIRINAPIWQRWWFISICIILIFSSLVIYIKWRTSKLAAEKKHLEEKVEERTTELKNTNELLSEAFTDIKDSINYAQQIQQAILPLESIIQKSFPDSFILYKPRDVVSGDFYWYGAVEKNGTTYHIIAAADCTGHGVPGAFMSMIGNTILSEIVIAKEIVDPSQILSLLHHGIRKALKQNLTTSRDGMDICLCSINLSSNWVKYAGAYNPLWILRNTNEIEVIKANKCAIGGFTEDSQIFESHEFMLQKGEAMYLFTDGYADQFGGEHGKKLTAKKFKEAILQVADKPMSQQKFYLQNYVEIWKGKEFQVDDILVIGLRV